MPNASMLSHSPELLPNRSHLASNLSPSLVPEKMHAFLSAKLEEFELKNITLIEAPYAPLTWHETAKVFKDYPRNRAAFLKMISYAEYDACRELGLSQEDIDLMKEGISPENYNTHLKQPFDFGGKVEFNNFSLLRSHPTHDQIHQLIELQITYDYLRTNKKIFIPTFKGHIYHD